MTVDAKKQAALMSHYFSDAAVDRQVQERTDRATVLEAAKAYLAQFSSSRDAWEIQKALNRHAVLGLAVQQERTLLERRILKLVARARTRMTDALVLSAPPDDCMKAIAKYGHWPQVEAEKKALVRFLDDAVVNAYNLLDIAGINTVWNDPAFYAPGRQPLRLPSDCGPSVLPRRKCGLSQNQNLTLLVHCRCWISTTARSNSPRPH